MKEILENWGRNIISSDHAMRLLSAHVPRLIAEAERLRAEVERLKPYEDELRKIAEDVGEGDDPFAAWESIASLALPAPAQAEPVAWQAIGAVPDDDETFGVGAVGENPGFMEVGLVEELRRQGFTMFLRLDQPLYAAPSPPAGEG